MADWIDIAIAAIGSYSEGKEKDKDRKQSIKDLILMQRYKGIEDRASNAFDRELQDYYKQLGNERSRKSFSNFSKYANPSTREDPNNPYERPVLGANPGDVYRPLYQRLSPDYNFAPSQTPGG